MHMDPTYIPVDTVLDGRILAMGLLSVDGSLFVQMALFLVLMAVLNKLLFKPTLEAVNLREERTTGARDEADRLREDADGKIAEFDRRMKESRQSANEERKKLRDEGAGRRQELVDAARSEANELTEGGRKELAAATSEARKGVTAAADALSGQIVARLLSKGAAVLLVVGFSSDAWASGAPHSAGEFLTGAFFAAVNLAILGYVAVRMGKAGTQEFLKNRQSEVTRELADAKRLREEAEEMVKEFAGKLDGLEDERKALLEQFTAEGELEKSRLIEEGKAQSERLRTDAKRTIDLEIRRAQLQLHGEVLDRALAQATERLTADIGAVEHKGLVDEFVGRVRSMGDAGLGVR